MERRIKKEESAGGSSVIDCVKSLAAKNARAPLDSEEQMLLFLQSWWSRTYNRPLKDPLLLSYSLEELLYEFYDKIERVKAEQERFDKEDVKIEEKKEKEVLDWAEEEERRELEAMKKDAASTDTSKLDPTKDPANLAWMEDQLQKAKQLYGEDFGEDIEESFEE